jgi:hypothetical protein
VANFERLVAEIEQAFRTYWLSVIRDHSREPGAHRRGIESRVDVNKANAIKAWAGVSKENAKMAENASSVAAL